MSIVIAQKFQSQCRGKIRLQQENRKIRNRKNWTCSNSAIFIKKGDGFKDHLYSTLTREF